MSFISYAQNFEDVILWRALGHVSSGFYIDVGAWSPVVDSVTLAFYERGWRGINVEPNPEFHSQLQRDRPRDINLAVAVADVPGMATMHFLDNPGLSTLVDAVAAIHAENGMHGQNQLVEVTTLAEIWRRYVPPGQPVQFLKIDVEGAEGAVIRGNNWAAFRPWVVVVEATAPMSQERTHQVWEPQLLAVGYQQAYDDGINRFYIAEEHTGLLPAFDHPPNYFDRFVPFEQVRAMRWGEESSQVAAREHKRATEAEAHLRQAEQRITQTERQLAQAERQVTQAHERARHAERRTDEALHRLEAVHASHSWRVTAPLRRVADVLLQLGPGAFKPGLARLLRAGGELDEAPVARAMAPDVEARAAHLDPDAEYPPRVLRLRAILEHLAGDDVPALPQVAQPRLAYVSPLPPECSGIADYSAQLIPALSEHYCIDVVVEQAHIDAPEVLARCTVRNADWLRGHAAEYNAVLYHFGNSHFHTWMFDLLRQVPGVVVLHDFFLGGLIWSLSERSGHADQKLQELYYGHGHAALAECLRSSDPGDSFFRYPCNRSVLEYAQAVIVHSEEPLRLARRWYGAAACADWLRIPLARSPAQEGDRRAARRRLGLSESAFIVCNFGLVGSTKLNHRLLQAWLGSSLAEESDGLLVFVGDAGKSDYSAALRARIAASGLGNRILITGWADAATFRDYLAAADLAVQLRSHSRGETSATVLDCMNHGLPTIVNAHGSMAELPEDAVCRLPDAFDDAQLTAALEQLRRDQSARQALGERARAVIASDYAPSRCAGLYKDAIEQFVAGWRQRTSRLEQALRLGSADVDGATLLALAERIAPDEPNPYQPAQLLLDVTETSRTDRRTGIERVARALTLALLESPPLGFRVEPVYLSQARGRWHYRYANAFAAGLLDVASPVRDQRIDYAPGDRLLCMDFSGEAFVQASREGLFQRLQESGVGCRMLVYDLLPLLEPECFPPGAERRFGQWLDHVARLDGAVCISRTSAEVLRGWMQQHHEGRAGGFRIDSFPLGADIAAAAPSRGLPHDAEVLLARLAAEPSVLMVGTLEPRKGYMQALLAFTRLWREGSRINLVIVGRAGWQDLPPGQQRDIPELLQALRTHPQCGRRLFWLDGISDEYLERVYVAASGLLAASKDEGFGLPLIEAGSRGLPILARDIPVFREVAGEDASYFRAETPDQLADALAEWAARGFLPRPGVGAPRTTWKESASALTHVLLAPPEGAH